MDKRYLNILIEIIWYRLYIGGRYCVASSSEAGRDDLSVWNRRAHFHQRPHAQMANTCTQDGWNKQSC